MPEEPSNKPPGQRPPLPGPTFRRGLMGWLVFGTLVAVMLWWVLPRLDKHAPMNPSDFWAHARNNEIKSLRNEQDRIRGELKQTVQGWPADTPMKFYVFVNFEADHTFGQRLEEVLKGKDVDWGYADPPGWFANIWPHILVWGLLFLLIWFLVFRKIGQGAGAGGFLGSFGRSRHRLLTKEHTNVTFDDIAGIEEAKDEVAEIITFLKNPRKFQRIGGRIPRGVLLVGEPGCGKTLLAKAIAGQAEVPFFSISGSDFVEMFVGVGASRVRDLFRQAKESSPCIIFLDEIDAVGRRRGMGFNGGGHDEREQTLNAILVEMDGFGTNDQVIVIAATNRMDVLDPALTRPGRFDRQIQVPLPDLKGRYEILQIYAAKVQCGPDVDLHRLARGTPMFSGADLAALVNEAAIAATMAEKEFVEMADLEEARDKVRWGRARKSRVIDEKEKETTAHHEAGHAMVQVLLPDTDPLHKVSIIPRGPMGGATFSLPEKDRYLYTRKYCKALICVLFGGRVAEETFCGDVSSGAQSDIAQATEIAKKMVLDWGMSEKLGLINYAGEDRRLTPLDLHGKEYSDQTAQLIDSEIRAIVDQAQARTRELIEANRDKLQRLAKALLTYETLSAAEVQQIFEGKELEKPSVTGLLQREQAKAAQHTTEAAASTQPLPKGEPPPLPQPG